MGFMPELFVQRICRPGIRRVHIVPHRARVIPLMVYRHTGNHKAPSMNQHTHLRQLSRRHVVGHIRPLCCVTRPDQFGITAMKACVTRAPQRHHLTCLGMDLSGSEGKHTCKRVSQSFYRVRLER